MRNAIILLLSSVAMAATAQTQVMRLSQKQGKAANYATATVDSVTMGDSEKMTVWQNTGTSTDYSWTSVDSILFLMDDGHYDGQLTSYHDKMRTRPYPQQENTLLVNPTALIVPVTYHYRYPGLQFQWSDSPSFSSTATVTGDIRKWCMFNLHKVLDAGTYYWRFRAKKSDSTMTGWSKTYTFTVNGDEPKFVTPSFAEFYGNLPTAFPRINCFLDSQMVEARKKGSTLEDYKNLISFASDGMTNDASILALSNPYSKAQTLMSYVEYVAQAYYFTQDVTYYNHLKTVLDKLEAVTLTDNILDLGNDNFKASYILRCLMPIYDLLHDSLSVSERQYVEKAMYRVLDYYYGKNCGYEEAHIFDNHYWQENYRVYLQAALLLYDNDTYRTEMREFLEYLYEIWTARAPASGMNRDGEWINGTGYFISNVETLYYVPMLFSYITKSDFLQHPWYKAAGKGLTYGWLPGGDSMGFGDGSQKYTLQRQRAAFADFIARELQDSYAGWYAGKLKGTRQRDPIMRLYRLASTKTYATTLPSDAAKMRVYPDMGLVMMHTNMRKTAQDVSLSMRSSQFGSGSHTLADQNAFFLQYHGTNVYQTSGYYLNFSDRFNLLSYRHSRAHNTILVDGKGQPYSTEGYGYIARSLGGSHINYCLGDASHAYGGITDDDMWVDAFAKAGISQTAEYGFGRTPLNKYRRHVLMLDPGIVVIYDDLGATEPVTWDWLLHSKVQFDIDSIASTFTTKDTYTAVGHLFSADTIHYSLTDKFFSPLTDGVDSTKYPNQWHLTARVGKTSGTRFLAILTVGDSSATPLTVTREGNIFKVGDWTIQAELNANCDAQLAVTNSSGSAVFDYGSGATTVFGDIKRTKAFSSILRDSDATGSVTTQETTDTLPIRNN